jgi:hypothetical protein
VPDEFDDLIESGTLSDDEEMQAHEPQSLPAGLGTARDLLPPDADEDEGDFEPGGLYKGFRILPEHLWPADTEVPRHSERWPQRFYVSSSSGAPGLVPWAGSQIVWPWERAWSVDLHRTEVQSLLKEEKGKHK